MPSIFDYIKAFFTGEPVKKKKKKKKKKRPINAANRAQQQTQHAPQRPPLSSQVNAQSATVKHDVETEVSDVQEYLMMQTDITEFDILLDSLGLVKRKFVAEAGVITIPFDASGCDVETKRQLSFASAQEFRINNKIAPNLFICSEVARRMFSAIRNTREECYVAGYAFISINQDIDADGCMVVEVTNTENGNTVLFDVPAAVLNDGSTEVNFDLIERNLSVATKKVQ